MNVENNPESIRENLSRYENASDVVIILDSDRYWKKNRDVFKEFDYPVQLFSIMRAYYLVMKPQLREVYDLLENDLSREIFTAALNVRFKIQPDNVVAKYASANQYFALPQMILLNPIGSFVDCGSFVGDVIEKFLFTCDCCFDKIFAFEPSSKQRKALEIRRKRLLEEWALDESKIQILPYGVGEENTDAFIVNRGADLGESRYKDDLGSRTLTNDSNRVNDENADAEKIKIIKLDNLLKNENVSFIKADIEGSEMSMLRGAANIIRTQKPLLAISLYHKLTDYYEIPLFIKSLVPEYHFEIRHHSQIFTETVLYCYI